MNAAVNALYAEYLEHTGGDKAAAASLALAAVLHEGRESAGPPPVKALTATEAADRLHLSRWTIYRLARTGLLHACRAGSALRFTLEEIERFEKEGGVALVVKAAPQFPDIIRRHTINRRPPSSSRLLLVRPRLRLLLGKTFFSRRSDAMHYRRQAVCLRRRSSAVSLPLSALHIG